MKQKDLALIIVVIFISVVISIVVSNSIITAPKNRQQKVEVVDPITADFPLPDKRYFNSESIDPTQIIKIGGNDNKQPFADGQQ